jgi:exonuclease SbcD
VRTATVVATGDIHIDGGRHGGRNPHTGLPTAWESTHTVWLDICTHAASITADAVVIPGDLFLNGWPKAEAVELLADGLRILEAADVPTVIADGNHEHISRSGAYRSPIEHFATFANVTVVTTPQLVILPSGLQVACLPWPRRQDLLEPDEMDDLTPIEIDGLVAARAAEILERLAGQADVGRGPVMLAAHATVEGAAVGSNKRGSEMALAELFAEPVLALADLDVDPWQNVALSHIHTRQHMGGRCAYLGSPDRLDFSDENVEKAFSVISLPDDGSLASVEAVATTARRFATVTVPEGVGEEDLHDLMPEDSRGVVVKVALHPGAELSLATEVRRAVEASGASVAVVHAPPLPRSADERAAVAEDIGPLEGLELWLATQTLTAEAADRLRAKASGLLDGSAVAEPFPS